MDIVITEPGKPSNPFLDRIKIVQGDIIGQDTDAIVTLLPQTLEYRGKINEAILKSCGEKLDHFVLDHIVEPVFGDIYAVPGFNLRCKHVFFCVVPPWRADFDRDDRYLLNSCRRAIEFAKEMGLKTIAFPPLGSGKNSFPKARAARLLVQGIVDRLDQHIDEVRIVCLREENMAVYNERLAALRV